MLNGIIKNKIEEKYGSKICYPKDCEALANHISSETGYISTSTVKRLFGFIKTKSRPNQYTLDLIAKYLNYDNWNNLKSNLNIIHPDSIEQVEVVRENKENKGEITKPSKNIYFKFGIVFFIITIIAVVFLFYSNINSNSSKNSNIKWSTLASLPEVRNNGCAVSFEDEIFYIGGADAVCQRNNTWVLKNNIWFEKSPLPISIAEMGCALVGKKIYCFGGWQKETKGPTNKAEVYDIENNKWDTLPSMPNAITLVSAVNINNNIYILGGTLDETKTYFYKFDTETNEYHVLPTFKNDRMNVCLVATNNKILAIGGNSFSKGQYNIHDDVDEYNPAADKWVEKTKLPSPITRSSAVFKDNQIHLFGGSILFFNELKDIKNFHFIYSIENNNWVVAEPLPFNICSHKTILSNGKIVILGGNNEYPNPSKIVYKENP